MNRAAESQFELLPGTPALIQNLRASLDFGHALQTKTLLARAEHFLHKPITAGLYDFRYLYDCLEVALHQVMESRTPALQKLSPAETLIRLETLLSLLPTQRVRTTEQSLYQQFSTPAPLAFVATCIALANRAPGVLLEPSAGTAALACLARALGSTVHTNDLSPARRAFLRWLEFPVYSVDAEYLHDLLTPELIPDVILMNPPFSATAGRVLHNDNCHGARHIQSSLSRLAPNGRLVAIASAGLALDRPKTSNFWQRIANTYTIKANLSLPGSTFTKFGTSWETQLIVIEKTGPTPGATWDQQLQNTRYGPATLLEVFTLLKNDALLTPPKPTAIASRI